MVAVQLGHVADHVGVSAGDATRAGVAWAAEMLTSSG
jgi:hypothetical protein